ncbi:hypothetical protein [Pseudoxanthomonas sp. PXM02]|uniref:hypothetical protein n=1 Tax=Pseudoxanthomonas sp. PXM02 TaxID=2769294 RepID=UPI001781618D|nr:hypothetical protein [Pseudoxanthomonas sp. PXM02]MBD9478820.1 hypothetical protein [Pseudoxanthomonas sp. PXM02]
MKQARALAMLLFDTYSEMGDEEQAQALATLRTVDPAVHDALVQLLVTDVLDHTLDARPWLAGAVPAPADDDEIDDPPCCDGK